MGFYIVHLLSFFGLETTINYQLNNRAPADMRDSDGRMPLSYTAENGHEGAVTLLLMWGHVEVSLKDKNNHTPLSYAAMKGHEKVATYFWCRMSSN